MKESIKKRNMLLGEPIGTASNKLRKLMLFKLVCETEKDICFRCGKKIELASELSIEHKKPWMNAENPVESFYDLENISFSHLNCNSLAGEKKVPHPTIRGENNGNVKLTAKQVKEIRSKLSDGISLGILSEEYNISKTNIRLIRDNGSWKYI